MTELLQSLPKNVPLSWIAGAIAAYFVFRTGRVGLAWGTAIAKRFGIGMLAAGTLVTLGFAGMGIGYGDIVLHKGTTVQPSAQGLVNVEGVLAEVDTTSGTLYPAGLPAETKKLWDGWKEESRAVIWSILRDSQRGEKSQPKNHLAAKVVVDKIDLAHDAVRTSGYESYPSFAAIDGIPAVSIKEAAIKEQPLLGTQLGYGLMLGSLGAVLCGIVTVMRRTGGGKYNTNVQN